MISMQDSKENFPITMITTEMANIYGISLNKIILSSATSTFKNLTKSFGLGVLHVETWHRLTYACTGNSGETSNPVGSDHRIVSTTIQMSFCKPKSNSSKRLNLEAIRSDADLGSRLDALLINSMLFPKNRETTLNS